MLVWQQLVGVATACFTWRRQLKISSYCSHFFCQLWTKTVRHHRPTFTTFRGVRVGYGKGRTLHIFDSNMISTIVLYHCIDHGKNGIDTMNGHEWALMGSRTRWRINYKMLILAIFRPMSCPPVPYHLSPLFSCAHFPLHTPFPFPKKKKLRRNFCHRQNAIKNT